MGNAPLLPGASDLKESRFLDQFTWTDFRNGVSRAGLERLEAGIRKGLPKSLPPQRTAIKGPKVHNLPFHPLGDFFKGRTSELALLAARLSTTRRAAAIVQSQTIHGLGGIGKTRLAVEYAWRYGSRYTAAFFLHADSASSLRASLAQLTRRPFFNLPEGESATESQQVDAVLLELRLNPGWLLILDNVDSDDAASAVSDLLPLLRSPTLHA